MPPRRFRDLALLVLLSAVGQEAVRLQDGRSPVQRVRRLIQDIQQSAQKVSEDADLTFNTLDAYGQQLQLSLTAEIGALNKTYDKLIAKQAKRHAESRTSEGTLRQLTSALQGSQHVMSSYEQGTEKVGHKFDTVLGSVETLIAALQNSVITPKGSLVTPDVIENNGQPPKVVRAVAALLNAHARHLPDKYDDVLHAFGTGALDEIKMTPKMLAHTVAAVQWIQGKLRSQKLEALGQFESKVQKYESDAAATAANFDVQQGTEAENDREAEELSFSISFTKAVVQKDSAFLAMVADSAKVKSKLMTEIHELRANEQKTVRALLSLLSKKSLTGSDDRASSFEQLSFLELGSHLRGKPRMSSLQQGSSLHMQIQAAMHSKNRKADMHSLLMKIKASFDKSQEASGGVEVGSVRDVISTLQDVLHEVSNEQSKAEEAKRKCDSQMWRAREEEHALKADLSLMDAAQNHAASTQETAQRQLEWISKKVKALRTAEGDCRTITSQALKSLEDGARDRSTIMVALSKAAELRDQQTDVVALLQQLQRQFTEEERVERSYREQQAALKAAFLQYTQGYVDVLKEREGHLQDAVAALELHSGELSDDEVAERDALASSRELKDENVELCDSFKKAYEDHAQRRLDLMQALKDVLPKVPELIDTEASEA